MTAVEAARRILRQTLDDEFIRPMIRLGLNQQEYIRLLDACAMAIVAHTVAALKDKQAEMYERAVEEFKRLRDSEVETALAERDAELTLLRKTIATVTRTVEIVQGQIEQREAALAGKEAELGIMDARRGTLGNMLRYIAFVLAGDEAADAQLAADRARTEIDDLRARLAAAEGERTLLDLKFAEACQMIDAIKAERDEAHGIQAIHHARVVEVEKRWRQAEQRVAELEKECERLNRPR